MRLAFFLIIMLIKISSAGIIEISEMDLSIFVKDKAHFRYEMTLKNLVDKPLVPGISELRLQKVESSKLFIFPLPFGEKRGAVELENLKAYSGDMYFKVYSENRGEYTTVYYEIWYPIEPLGERKIILEFNADLVERGLLFKSVTVPIGGDIDIKKVKLNLTSDWKLCYLERGGDTIPANHIAFLTAEFSLLPLPLLPIRGYILFWGSIIFLIILILSIILKKKKKKLKGEKS
ncbi:MAG: hypothetical protein RMH75_02080 [Archaeoglobaceae archaeon]|nr:hypothetical protein [Archaeoglobaceae archaeon]MDW7989445.1 hypothetical protein [Archaeoglobaceae archaeon]